MAAGRGRAGLLTDLAVQRIGDQPVDIKLAEERLHAELDEIEGELGEVYLRELRGLGAEPPTG